MRMIALGRYDTVAAFKLTGLNKKRAHIHTSGRPAFCARSPPATDDNHSAACVLRIADFPKKSVVRHAQIRKGRIVGQLRKMMFGHHGTVPTIDQVLATLPQAEIVVAPDSEFKYSNLGYSLLGEVIARVSKSPYVDYIQREILDPLGRFSSRFSLGR